MFEKMNQLLFRSVGKIPLNYCNRISGILCNSNSFCWSEFSLPSTLQLSPFLKTLLEPVGCKESFFRIELGLHEALVNAVLHGNDADPTKSLRVRRILTPNWMIWQVQDEGDGIPLSSRKNTLPIEIDAVKGRGLFLVYKCFDDVRWSQKGNRIQLAYKQKNI